MSLWRHLLGRILGWVLLVLALMVGLTVLAGTVEGVRFGLGSGLRLAALEALPVVVPLVPIACALGAGLASARLHALGEAVALESVGIPPRRVAGLALLVGLLVGAGAGLVQALVVPAVADHALDLRVSLGAQAAPAGWLWIGHQALRTRDGTAVRVISAREGEGGEGAVPWLDVVPGAGPPSSGLVRQARALRRPAVAGPEQLRLDSHPLQVERAVRWMRWLGCGLLAALAWLGPGRRRPARLGPALALGLAWQGLAVVLAALAAGGQLGVWAGAGGPVAVLMLLLGYRLRQ